MKANELRIGNIVFKRGAREIHVIEGHNINQLQKWELTKYARTPPFEPIPLTEEWLLRMGFEDCFSEFIGPVTISWAQRIVSTAERKSFYLDGEIPESWKIRIDSVHQLQNIIFALTGAELEITEK